MAGARQYLFRGIDETSALWNFEINEWFNMVHKMLSRNSDFSAF